MKRKQIIAIILAGVAMLSAGAAETLATPLLVEQGFYHTTADFLGGTTNVDDATFSGDNFAVSNLGNHESNYFEQVFITGILEVGFGVLSSSIASHGTIQVGDVSCQAVTDNVVLGLPVCGAALRFVHAPLTVPPTHPPQAAIFVSEAPFTMMGQLVLPDLIVDIEGSGIVTGTADFFGAEGELTGYHATYNFAVPEPSSVLLLFTGVSALLVARRRRASAGLRDRV